MRALPWGSAVRRPAPLRGDDHGQRGDHVLDLPVVRGALPDAAERGTSASDPGTAQRGGDRDGEGDEGCAGGHRGQRDGVGVSAVGVRLPAWLRGARRRREEGLDVSGAGPDLQGE